MMRSNVKRIAFLLPLLVSTCGLSMASYDQYTTDSNSPVTNPINKPSGSSGSMGAAPSPGAAASNVDNYINQNDQLNLNKDAGVVKVLRTNQKNETNEFVPKLIPIKSAKVRELRSIARQIVGIEGGAAEVVNDTEKKQTFIQVTCPPFQVPYVDAAIRALDKEWLSATDDGTEVGKYVPKFRDATDTNRIAMIYAGGGIASSVIDATNNTATHWNDPSQVKNYVKVSEAADIPVSEIAVNANFYEVTDNTTTKIGVDYLNWKNGPGRNLFELVQAAERTDSVFKNVHSIYSPLPNNADAVDKTNVHTLLSQGTQHYSSVNAWLTAAYVDFLKVRSKAKVVASASLHSYSGSQAVWQETTDPVITAGTGTLLTSVTFTGGQPVTSITSSGSGQRAHVYSNSVDSEYDTNAARDPYIPVWERQVNNPNNATIGLYLSIVPYIGTESAELSILAADSNITGTTVQNQPIVDKRVVSSYVRVRDGETIILGGLKRTNKAKNTVGMPFLSTVPYAGYLFGNESTADEKSDVVITLDPTISVKSDSKIAKTSGKMTEAAVKAVKDADYSHNCYGFDQWMLDTDSPRPCVANCPLAIK